MGDELVLVTGASGYVATHVVQLLQQQGYQVRATVRSLTDKTKVKPLRELCPDAKHPLELVEADLFDDESWTHAVRGCTYVIHTAHPHLPEQPSNEDDVTKPAVSGMLAVLRACSDEGVRRVVVTSSGAAVTTGCEARETPFTEEDWTDLDRARGVYVKSKVSAEKAAWDFVNNLPEERRFELAVVNPLLVVGPVLCGSYAACMDLPKRLLQREMPGLPKFGVGFVDVRDVALGHVNAMTIPEAAGHRHLLVGATMTIKDMAVVLDEEFRPQGYNVPTMEVPNFLIRIASFFDKLLSHITPFLGSKPAYDNTRMTQVLGIAPRDVKGSLIDMAYSMIELGHIKKWVWTTKFDMATWAFLGLSDMGHEK